MRLLRQAGWKVTGEYIDERSGKNGDRVEFQHMMANAYQREFDVVLFWSLDRFSREQCSKGCST
jgi:DNA invertase Pin-like site-specific DNA recombinase